MYPYNFLVWLLLYAVNFISLLQWKLYYNLFFKAPLQPFLRWESLLREPSALGWRICPLHTPSAGRSLLLCLIQKLWLFSSVFSISFARWKPHEGEEFYMFLFFFGAAPIMPHKSALADRNIQNGYQRSDIRLPIEGSSPFLSVSPTCPAPLW